MTPFATATALMRTGWQAWWLTAEAQTVIALRVAGMAGLFPQDASERSRMVTEKVTAFTASGLAAQAAMMRGAGPLAITDAAMKPLRKGTRSNVRRLTKRGRK